MLMSEISYFILVHYINCLAITTRLINITCSSWAKERKETHFTDSRIRRVRRLEAGKSEYILKETRGISESQLSCLEYFQYGAYG